MTNAARTILELLQHGAGDAPALTAPGGVPLTYQALRTLAAETLDTLARRGIGRNDPVAIVLDSGPEMAAAFVTVASGATAAPLNPAYRAEEFDFYLRDLEARLLIVGGDASSPAVAVASRLGIPVARLVSRPDQGAGRFRLEFPQGPAAGGRITPVAAQPEDTALVLHTSGTTSRPKMVPLSQRNVCASARNVRGTLRLTAEDRGLVIMPLFHIHGLMAALLAPLSAGAEVCCSPGFNALKFYAWLADVRPSWYTAVPTMHQAILARAAKNVDAVQASRLRLVRSSSSALPPQVLADLETTFRAPMIESYGMTEAAHQMTSNPLPPKLRKPGSVGPEAGPEVRVVDQGGDPVPAGVAGEVVIRGENVMRGYAHNPEANATAFIKGWFRTGDEGVMDADGYLRITGRLKEIINRGGEKISPREVDELIMGHPAVHQCVTFAIPHEMLGEEVGAAIVLKEGAQATEKELRQFAAECMADFKVPRKILIVREIPVGPTGKLQRIGLARALGLC